MVDRSAIEAVRRYLTRVAEAGIPAVSAVIFGSHARGEQTADSDIDVLVLSPLFDSRVDFDMVNDLWRLTQDVDTRIEPHAVGVKEFETDTGSPLIGIARQEGIVVPAPRAAAATTARRTLAPALVKERRSAYGKRAKAKSR